MEWLLKMWRRRRTEKETGRERRGTEDGRMIFQLVSCRLLTQMPVFSSRPVYMGFVVENVAMEQSFLQVLQFPPVSVIIPPVVYTLIHLPPTLYRAILAIYVVVN
jgi:hypothetical protein